LFKNKSILFIALGISIIIVFKVSISEGINKFKINPKKINIITKDTNMFKIRGSLNFFSKNMTNGFINKHIKIDNKKGLKKLIIELIPKMNS
ncbi:MAG: hypothetical protein RR942_17255, partial [Romboutsia sp.]